MTAKPVTMFTFVCDACGVDAFAGGETVAWESADSAEVMALESEFHRTDADRIVCWDCWARSIDEGP
jgi:hypothetical protein